MVMLLEEGGVVKSITETGITPEMSALRLESDDLRSGIRQCRHGRFWGVNPENWAESNLDE